MSAFDKLLGELTAAQTEQNTLAKSLEAAGEGVGGEGQGGEGEGAAAVVDGAAAAAAAAAAGEGQPLVKSMKVKLEDGSEVDAIDGGEMLKALEARIDTGEKNTTQAVTQLVALVKSQGALIKSLGEQVTGLRAEGRGRKTVLAVTERVPAGGQPMAKGGDAAHAGEQGEVGVEEFLAKSESAWKSGAITGKEFTTIDVACRSKSELDPGLIKKVLASKN